MKRSPFLSDKDAGKMETLGLTAVVFLSSRRKLMQDSEADTQKGESGVGEESGHLHTPWASHPKLEYPYLSTAT